MDPKAAAAMYGPSPSLAERSISMPDDVKSSVEEGMPAEANEASELSTDVVSDEELPFEENSPVGVEESPEPMPQLPIQIKVEREEDVW